MMKPNELRIGNLLDVGGNYWQVDSIVNNGQWEVYFKENEQYDHWLNAKPIRLTQEWLTRLGFKRYSFEMRLGSFHLEASSRTLREDILNSFYLCNVPEELKIRVEYVHELQNLHYALTGEELILNKQHPNNTNNNPD